MKVKLNEDDLGIIINGLFQYWECFDDDTNNAIAMLVLRLVEESNTIKTNRKKKIPFTAEEISLIRVCLIEWRNEEIQNNNAVATQVIGEVLILF